MALFKSRVATVLQSAQPASATSPSRHWPRLAVPSEVAVSVDHGDTVVGRVDELDHVVMDANVSLIPRRQQVGHCLVMGISVGTEGVIAGDTILCHRTGVQVFAASEARCGSREIVLFLDLRACPRP